MKNTIKNVLLVALAVLAFGLPSVEAKEFTAKDINDISVFDEDANYTVFVFGGHVYFNTISMADLVAASNTLNGKTDAILYYKDGANNWYNGITYSGENSTKLDMTNVVFDIVKITKTINADETDKRITDIASNEGFIKTETNGNKLSELFEPTILDETIKLNSVRILPAIELEGEISGYHKYNQESLKVEYDNKNSTLSISENRPLVKYNNGYANNEWFGLLVDLNRDLDAESYEGSVKLTLYNIYGEGYYDYNIELADIKDASRHGAKGNEFIIWLNGNIDDLKNSTMIFTEYDKDLDIIDVERVKFAYANSTETPILTIDSDKEITSTTSNVNCYKVGVGENSYRYFFYQTDKSEMKEFTFTQNGVGMVAKYVESNWITYQPLGVPVVTKANGDVNIGEYTNDHKWNQGAITVSTPVESEEEDVDYEVTVTKNKEMISYGNSDSNNEWYSVIVDLEIDPSNLQTAEGYKIEAEDIEDAARHGAGDTGFVVWLKGNNKTRDITFINKGSSDDKITVSFVVDNKIPQLEVTAKLADKNTQLYPGTDDVLSNEESKKNADYTYNMASLALSSKYNETSDLYVIYANASRPLRNYVGGNNADVKWYGVILDLGIDPSKLETENYEILPIDIAEAKRFGADGTEFIVWLKAEDAERDIIFTNKDTKDTVDVKFVVTEVSILEDDIEGTVTIADDFKNVVEYGTRNIDGNNKTGFFINNGTTEFDFVVGGVKYTYTHNGTTWSKAQSLKLSEAYIGKNLEEYSADQKYNQDAIKKVEIVDNTINVVFNRTLSKGIIAGGVPSNWYSLVLDLGIINSKLGTEAGYSIETVDKEEANRHVDETNASDNNVVIWLTASATDSAAGKTITFVNTDNEAITYDVVIKSTYDEDNELALTSAKAAVITEGLAEDAYYDEMKYNNAGLSTTIPTEGADKGKVVITTNRPLNAYINNSGLESAQKWFAVLVNLGIDTEQVGTVDGGYEIRPEDKDAVQVQRFGGNDKEVILWLRQDSFVEDELNITFTNSTESNKYDTLLVTFKIVTDIEELELNSVKMANAVGVGDFTERHALNQKNIAAALTEDKNIKISTIGETVKYDNGHGEKTWFAVLVDFDVDPKLITTVGGEGEYIIETADREDAARHGATGTEFILWLNKEDLPKTITFKNTYNLATTNVIIAESVID